MGCGVMGPAFAGRLAEVLWQAPVARLSHSAAIRHRADRMIELRRRRQPSSRCHGNQLAARAWEVTLRVKSVPNDAFALCLSQTSTSEPAAPKPTDCW